MSLRRLVFAGGAACCPLYLVLLRRSVLTWGATGAEAESRLPGDELLEDADGVATRAIEIRAPASAVWPWVAQMGPSPRGGAYSYDWIENLLGLNMHSANTVLPEFQHPEVGDTIGYGTNRMRVKRVEPERVLAWRSEDGNWVWAFVLNEVNGSTRLISRNRYRLSTAGRPHRHGGDGACFASDGAQDAGRDQAARGAARGRRQRKRHPAFQPRRGDMSAGTAPTGMEHRFARASVRSRTMFPPPRVSSAARGGPDRSIAKGARRQNKLPMP